MLYFIDTGYAYGGIIVEDDICIKAAPIFKWMIGKKLSEIKKWKKIISIGTVEDYK